MFSAFNLNPQSSQQTPGVFGSQNAPQSQQQPFQNQPLFGQQPSQSVATPGLFGQPSQQPFASTFGQPTGQMPSQPLNLFSQQQQQQQQPSSLFGQTPATQIPSSFNQPQPQQTPSLFGQQPFSFASQQQQQPSLFAPATQPYAPQLLQQPQQALPEVLQYVQAIQTAYDPLHPQCRFRHFFYNLVHPNDVTRYQKPENVDEVLWQQALINSPDASCMVPVLATGFDDLLKRAFQQDEMIFSFTNKITELENQISKLRNKHELENHVRIEQLQHRHMAQSQRLVHMMRRLQVLLHRGTAIQPQEEAFRAKIESIQHEADRPNQYSSKLNAMLADLHTIQSQLKLRPNMNDSLELTPESLPLVEQLLSEQTKGLASLADLIHSSLKDIETMSRGYGERPMIVP